MMLPGAGRVQVDESGAAGRVAHTFHQLTRVGTRFSDELITGMAQVMQVNAETGCGERATPDAAAEVGVPQKHAVRAGEHQRIGFWLGEGVQVRADVGHDQGRYRNGALASVGLGSGEERLATGYLAELAGDTDGLFQRALIACSLSLAAAAVIAARATSTRNEPALVLEPVPDAS